VQPPLSGGFGSKMSPPYQLSASADHDDGKAARVNRHSASSWDVIDSETVRRIFRAPEGACVTNLHRLLDHGGQSAAMTSRSACEAEWVHTPWCPLGPLIAGPQDEI